MTQHPTFETLFFDCPAEEFDRAALSALQVREVHLNREQRTMEVVFADTGNVANDEFLLRAQRSLSVHYGLRHVKMTTFGKRPVYTPAAGSGEKSAPGDPLWGKPPKSEPIPMSTLHEHQGAAVIEGQVFASDVRPAKNGAGTFVSFDMTDNTDSVRVACYVAAADAKGITNVQVGQRLRVGGRMEFDQRDKNGGQVFRPSGLMTAAPLLREDTAAEGRRVELHLHTRMSAMDATTDVEGAVRTAARWGHPAIAITDHGVLHAFPDAMAAQKKAAKAGQPIKVIYGCEGYLIDDAPAEQATGKKSRVRSHHIILLAKNQTGLFNLYKLVSKAHIGHFNYHANIPRSLLTECREGLIVGAACERGEVFSALVKGASEEQLKSVAAFYDYLEIQPLCNNDFMLHNGMAGSREQLRDFNRAVVALGRALGKPVAATGDVHFLEPQDEIYRSILMAAKKMPDPDRSLPLYFKTTDEMLEEFSYLGAEEALRVVIEAPGAIASQCEELSPVRKGEFFPKIEGSAEELRALSVQRAADLYGENQPAILTERMQVELDAIVGKGYDIIYMIAQKLVYRSLSEGYLVGSRGSVGSSIVAYLAGITEVNALPPHYRCPACLHWHFPEQQDASCGADLPDYSCPQCGGPCLKDGFDIPFATFLGFEADKKPDIDLNFSGEYQARAHQHTIDLFGEGKVFRAGTIGTVAQKTATGFVLKYLEERGRTACSAEIARLAIGCVGVKRTTGQHPGGLIVVPHDNDIYEFCPVQHPADKSGDIVTTHFDYHSIEENLLKLDLLGHDDPTMIRRLEEITGVNAQEIPLDDPETMSLFVSPRALGLANDPVLGKTGACAIPEFGTRFVREMLTVTKPSTFDELVRISGLSHGTDVWLGNAADIIKAGKATLKEVICARDDIMLYLIAKGMDRKMAFTIMESVRKGKGLTPDWVSAMRAAEVPDWYIESCQKIKYMFPKAHAVAYVIMAFRIAWFKVHHPLAFYAAYFSIRAGAFDAAVMTHGLEVAAARMTSLDKQTDRSAVQEDELSTLEVCYEFYKRGLAFLPIDIYRSDPTRFLVEDGCLRPPFSSLPGLGETAARDIERQREKAPFVSVEELTARCGKLSKTHVQQLLDEGALGDMPLSTQLNLFEM